MQRVLVLSYYNDPNFGDRLGYHVINQILPADVEVHHASVRPWSVPDIAFDLLVIGIGNSLNAATVRRDELFTLIDRVPRRIGVFGTQYRHQHEWAAAGRLEALVERLDFWYARYRSDIDQFGAARPNVRHLGDMLITAFPISRWRHPGTLTVPADIKTRTVPLDRTIQQIQRYRRVKSFRLHPLLCALTSADEVAYEEQTEDPRGETSGKFAAMLMDVFGTAYPPNQFFEVDRERVIRYKQLVSGNLDTLSTTIAELLT